MFGQVYFSEFALAQNLPELESVYYSLELGFRVGPIFHFADCRFDAEVAQVMSCLSLFLWPCCDLIAPFLPVTILAQIEKTNFRSLLLLV